MVDGWMPERDDNFPFRVRVVVIRARPPRDPYFEYFRDIGMLSIEKALYDKPGLADKPESNLMFFFPERHMSVQEQQMFMSMLANHHQTGNIAHVDIVTSNPLILSDFRAEQIRIINWPDDAGKYIGA
jgi:hypothetical protein